jgi:putative ABC transport system permease protein
MVSALMLASFISVTAQIKMPQITFRDRTLKNGMRVLSVVDKSSPTVAINVWYHVGSKDDPERRSGFAHLFEHIMFKSTRNMKAEMMDRLTEDVGGQNNAFTQDDVTTAANVAVIGETVRKNLFGATDPVGQTVRINNLSFKVVGLLTPKGTSAAMGQDQDDIILVPITTLQKKITGQDWLRWIMVSAASKDASYTAQQQITALLRDRHRIRTGQDDDFFVRNLADMADLADQNARLFTILLASIASISLLVGGIGIMNIMLVSVTERTREIGIRMAIGATEGDVQQQFLIEAVVLSVVGGGVGILSGMGASYLITQTLGWPVLVSPTAIFAAVLFSMAVGIFFGFYPARKAARLDPIEALRYE